MAEKNILAYFKSPEEAEGVKAKLEVLRAIDISIDRFSRYPGDGVEHIENPITGDITSLADLTLGADVSSRSAGILTAVDPGASGLSDGGQDDPVGRDILLTAVMPEETHEQAIQVIEQAGGML
ncbi:hypothetical protein DUZ99_05510 [Xylanibacillus composti]|uniref:Uncharacterized protein n=1 Tax=Xylanibacillus composti TaxID=1572762 RepID=A0A8J4H2E4_9BACL|nr:hypothetical protein [Xylanibacillus composti]MDT9724445.1 hypothetical protein [Xylanibacillus composti]GIQ69707.1 hypothetical protein XYCOK13_25310 [Xylanibacillus composti]